MSLDAAWAARRRIVRWNCRRGCSIEWRAPTRLDAHLRVDAAAPDAFTTLPVEVSVAGAASSNIPVAGA
jgi:hypothetical protein